MTIKRKRVVLIGAGGRANAYTMYGAKAIISTPNHAHTAPALE